MLKKMLIPIALVSCNVFAHGQSPIAITKNVVYPVNSVEITVHNLYDDRRCYRLTVNNVVTPQTICLNAKDKKKLDVWVRADPDVTSLNEVCSISIPAVKTQVKTRVCTKVNLFYPKSVLEQSSQ